MRDYKPFFAIIKKMGIDKEEVVSDFTNGRTKSLRELTDKEFTDLMRRLQEYNTLPPGDTIRKKMISLAKQMQWGTTTPEIIARLNGWLVKQKFKKPLMQLDVPQLALMLAVFEQRVYADYLTGLNK